MKKNKKEFIGYNDDELRGIEELYDIELKGDLRKFLSLGGKSLGGLLSDNVLTLYKEWSVRERILFQYTFQEYVIEDEFYGMARSGKSFVVGLENKTSYFFIVTRDEAMKVYHYDRSTRELKETGMDFNEYMVYLIKRYNPELKELQGVSISGDIINI